MKNITNSYFPVFVKFCIHFLYGVSKVDPNHEARILQHQVLNKETCGYVQEKSTQLTSYRKLGFTTLQLFVNSIWSCGFSGNRAFFCRQSKDLFEVRVRKNVGKNTFIERHMVTTGTYWRITVEHRRQVRRCIFALESQYDNLTFFAEKEIYWKDG